MLIYYQFQLYENRKIKMNKEIKVYENLNLNY